MRERVHSRVKAGLRSLALAAGLIAAVPLPAQDFPARDVRGWTVAASRDGEGCFATRTFDGAGQTTLLLGLNSDGSHRLTVLNDNWSIKPKANLKLSFQLSKGGYSNHRVVGLEAGKKKGFVTSFDANFPARFAASRFLHIFRGEVPVEQLALDGSGAAVIELRRCVDLIGGKGAKGGEAERSDRIPKDPFAPDAKAKSGK